MQDRRSNGGEGAVSELRSALDALAADDVPSLAPRQQLDRITEILEARNRLDAQLARSVRAAELQQGPADDGLKTMQSWLRGPGRLSPAAAGQLVRNGRAEEHTSELQSHSHLVCRLLEFRRVLFVRTPTSLTSRMPSPAYALFCSKNHT